MTQKRLPFTTDGSETEDSSLNTAQKMRFDKIGKAEGQSVIVYNEYITLSCIQDETHDYIVNGKSAVRWVMQRYDWTQDKESRIVNDPNEWSDDPRYIIDSNNRIVRVNMETNRIVANLPALNERDVEIAA